MNTFFGTICTLCVCVCVFMYDLPVPNQKIKSVNSFRYWKVPELFSHPLPQFLHILTFRTLRPIYRTGVKLPSRCPILYLFNKYPY